ncbi:hypothetical protein [Tepidiforma sp.]|uniref:hypothetical protein n=1 Tax=Tepidiforma sp. TaxID=2682230 RepID=UPI002ADD3BE7|nr:hypothetical protein [Tepidiforma sp.]
MPVVLAVAAVVAAACACGGPADAVPTPMPSVPPDTPTPALSPTPSPTPDPLGPPPADVAAARAALHRNPGMVRSCSPALAERWNAACISADIDGDLIPDTALLVPLATSTAPAPNPGVIFVELSTRPGLEALSPPAAADVSILGRAVFTIADRDGLPRPEVSFLENLCTASRCTSLVRIYSWDGSAWRDLGPADAGIESIDRVALEGSGPATAIVIHRSASSSLAAGPGRAGTFRYTLSNGRYTALEVILDPPNFLFHAILDADDHFRRGQWEEAIEAYTAAVENPALRDWKAENGRGESRNALVAYALFRIAVAAAASGSDPNPALDRVIREASEPVFVNAAEAFRKGYQDRMGVAGGCLEATRYLATTGPGVDTPAYIQRIFDHGYANPQYTFRDICPL